MGKATSSSSTMSSIQRRIDARLVVFGVQPGSEREGFARVHGVYEGNGMSLGFGCVGVEGGLGLGNRPDQSARDAAEVDPMFFGEYEQSVRVTAAVAGRRCPIRGITTAHLWHGTIQLTLPLNYKYGMDGYGVRPDALCNIARGRSVDRVASLNL